MTLDIHPRQHQGAAALHLRSIAEHGTHHRSNAVVHTHLDDARARHLALAPRSAQATYRARRVESAVNADATWGWNGVLSGWMNAAAIGGAIVAAGAFSHFAG